MEAKTACNKTSTSSTSSTSSVYGECNWEHRQKPSYTNVTPQTSDRAVKASVGLFACATKQSQRQSQRQRQGQGRQHTHVQHHWSSVLSGETAPVHTHMSTPVASMPSKVSSRSRYGGRYGGLPPCPRHSTFAECRAREIRIQSPAYATI